MCITMARVYFHFLYLYYKMKMFLAQSQSIIQTCNLLNFHDTNFLHKPKRRLTILLISVGLVIRIVIFYETWKNWRIVTIMSALYVRAMHKFKKFNQKQSFKIQYLHALFASFLNFPKKMTICLYFSTV